MARTHSFQVLILVLLQFFAFTQAQTASCPGAETASIASDGSTWYICSAAIDRSATTQTISLVPSVATCRNICLTTSGCKRAVYDTLLRYCLLKGSASPSYTSNSRYQSVRFGSSPPAVKSSESPTSSRVPTSSAVAISSAVRTSSVVPASSVVRTPSGISTGPGVPAASILPAERSRITECLGTESEYTTSNGVKYIICTSSDFNCPTLQTFPETSAEACAIRCDSTTGCSKAVWAPNNRLCHLKGNPQEYNWLFDSTYSSIRRVQGVPSSMASASTSRSSAIASVAVSRPSSLASAASPRSSLVNTLDGSCGGTSGFTCIGFSLGSCCSPYNWCGSSEVHCGTGCQTAFGECGSGASMSVEPSIKPSASVATSSLPTSSSTISIDGSCGTTSGFSCLGFSSGECCSAYNWCGSSQAHCGDGCQKGFGKCDASPSASSPSISSPVNSASASPVPDQPCPCGYRTDDTSIYTEAIESDFVSKTTSLSGLAADWLVQEYTSERGANGSPPYNKLRSSKNMVFSKDQGLQMLVRAVNGRDVGTSEMRTIRNDIQYGSFRTSMRYTDVVGTCGAFFFYQSDKAEIDVELLSKDPWYAQLVVHSGQVLPSSEIYDRRYLGFQTGAGYNDYRFDWKPSTITYSFNGQAVRTMTKGVPQVGGGIYFNHWSDGSDWTGAPPTRDASMTIRNARLYFNSSDPSIVNSANQRCQAARLRGKGEVCDVRRT